jgi:hypothetical protein
LPIDGQLEFHRLLDRQVCRLFAFENPPGVATSEAIGIGNTRAVTDQSANVGKLSQIIDCWERMARCEPDQLIAPAQKERIGAYDDGINMLLNETREGCVDIAFAAGIQGNELDAVCARRSLNVCGLGLRRGISGVDEDRTELPGLNDIKKLRCHWLLILFCCPHCCSR